MPFEPHTKLLAITKCCGDNSKQNKGSIKGIMDYTGTKTFAKLLQREEAPTLNYTTLQQLKKSLFFSHV